MPLQGRLSIEHMCQLVAVSRRGFYRSLRQREPAEEETEVRSLIQQIALELVVATAIGGSPQNYTFEACR